MIDGRKSKAVIFAKHSERDEYFAFIKKRQEVFNRAWETFKQSSRIKELLAYLTSKGIVHPYNENILITAFTDGYNANKNNNMNNYLSEASDTELLERFATSLNTGAIGSNLFREIQRRKLVWVVNCQIPEDTHEAKKLLLARLGAVNEGIAEITPTITLQND